MNLRPNKQIKWVDLITPFLQIVNNLPHASTGLTPSELIYSEIEDDEWVKPLPRIPTPIVRMQDRIRQAFNILNEEAQRRKRRYDS